MQDQGLSSKVSLSKRQLLLIVLLTVLAYAAFLSIAGTEQVWQSINELDRSLWVLVVSLSMLSYALRALRWHLLLNIDLEINVPWYLNTLVYFSGFSLTMLPGKVGEVIRSLFLKPLGVDYAKSLSTFLVERMLDLLVVGVLATLAAGYVLHQGLPFLALLTLVIMLLVGMRLPIVSRILQYWSHRKLGQLAYDTQRAMICRVQPLSLLYSLPLTGLSWCSQALALYGILYAFGYPLNLALVIGLYCVGLLAGAASMLPGGLGVTEATLSLILTQFGVNTADAISATLATRILTFWLAVVLGWISAAVVSLVVLPRLKEP
jgi:uncharacterized protein (TIRG00374 family)